MNWLVFSNIFFMGLMVTAADTTKVQRIYDGVILDGISEHLKGIGEGLKGNFQNLNDAEKQGTNTVLEYLQSLEKTIGAKLESMEKKANDKLTKLQEALVGLNLQLKGYEYGGVSGRYLKLYSEPKKNWADARRTCQLEGGELVIVDFPIINEWLAKQDMKYGQLWIGATDMVKDGTYVWTNGVEATNEYWYPGQPNNYGGQQQCATVNYRQPGKWDDGTCSGKLGFVCQIEFNA